jgi:hypothetical protein
VPASVSWSSATVSGRDWTAKIDSPAQVRRQRDGVAPGEGAEERGGHDVSIAAADEQDMGSGRGLGQGAGHERRVGEEVPGRLRASGAEGDGRLARVPGEQIERAHSAATPARQPRPARPRSGPARTPPGS